LYDRCGTIPYLAPEQKDREFHTQAVDIWAAALVGVELIGFRKSADKVTEAVYRDIRVWLGKRAKHPLAPCCMAMLRYEAEDRLSAAEALDSYLKGYIEPEKSTKRPMVGEDKKPSAKRYPSPWNES
jgi:serine/threonine protein kinase